MMKQLWLPANLLTILRFLLAPVVAAFILYQTYNAYVWALVLFVLAAVTDFFDGMTARLLEQESSLGKALDPVADKALVLFTMFALVYVGTIPLYHFPAIIMITLRELSMIYLDLIKKQKLQVLFSAKVKTTVQFLSILAFLFYQITNNSMIAYIAIALLWVAAGLSVYTGIVYARKSGIF